ncbi:MAG: right-handed parallel beta-helix repeat-containing protein [Candidatus Doudnabacteria bacterium]
MKSRYLIAGVIIAGCITMGLIAFTFMANADFHISTVSISGSSVIAVDGQSNVIKQGTLGVDDATVIQAALNALDKSNSVLTISPGTYTIDKTIVISSFSGLTVNAKGATIKLKYGYNGFYDDQNYGVYVVDCPSLKLNGLTIDGNKAGMTKDDNTLINFNHVDNGYVYDCTITNARYKGLAIRRGDSTNLTIDTCHFINNCDSGGMDSDVYCSAEGSSYTFKNCDFSRANLADSETQAFYIQSGTGYYYNNKFNNMQKAYDFRNGIHTVVNAYGTNCGLALATYDGQPTVSMTNAYFNGLSGHDDTVGGVWLATGKVTMDNVTLISSGARNAKYGIMITGEYSTITGTMIRNCKISGFSNAGIRIVDTGGQGLISGNTISNCGSYGFDSEGNTGTTTVSGNTITGVKTPYYAPDGMLDVQSTATSTPTPKPSTTPTPTVTASFMAGWNLAPTPLASQDNSVTTMLPTSMTSGLASIWGRDETKQNWAYNSPIPKNDIFQTCLKITGSFRPWLLGIKALIDVR